MDSPQEEFPNVARILAQGSRDEQRRLIQTLYGQDASFSHPFLECMGRDEIADAYDYWIHSHRRIKFTYKDFIFKEDKSYLLIFDFNPKFWPYRWPFKRHAYALHYDIEFDLRKLGGRWRVIRQDDTLRLLDTVQEVAVLGWIIGDENSWVRHGITKATVGWWRFWNAMVPEAPARRRQIADNPPLEAGCRHISN